MNIRKQSRKVSNHRITTREVDRLYNGGLAPYEDSADYIDRSCALKGVRVG